MPLRPLILVLGGVKVGKSGLSEWFLPMFWVKTATLVVATLVTGVQNFGVDVSFHLIPQPSPWGKGFGHSN